MTLPQSAKTIRRIVLLTVVYLMPMLTSLKPITDPDIWWHLGTGRWIVENGAVPATDPFSSYGSGKSWVAYSWLFDVAIYRLHETFGISGLVFYTGFTAFLITAAFHSLIRKLLPDFSSTTAITALGVACILPLLNPRPWLLTILFFIVELRLLLEVRRSGNGQELLYLPVLFLLWANIHIQFIYGLLLVALLGIESLLCSFQPALCGNAKVINISFRTILCVGVLCALATLATPYHVNLYGVIMEYMAQRIPFQYIRELLPFTFQSVFDWLALLSALLAIFTVGRARTLEPFPILLLIAGIFLSLRIRRDIWFLVVVASSLTAMYWPRRATDEFQLTTMSKAVLLTIAVAAAITLALASKMSEKRFEEAIARSYPVMAAAAVEQGRYSGPLYNHLNWGGYLIWRLPQLPVAMDGRTNLHGDERMERSFKTWTGSDDWMADSELAAARLVIASKKHALSSLLKFDRRFMLVYEDQIAEVFIARPHSADKQEQTPVSSR